MKFSLNSKQKEVLDALGEKGKVYFVGGVVRDYLKDGQSDMHDVDVEIHHLELSEVEEILSRFGTVNTVGQSFGILKLSSMPEFDFALPRIEKKIGLTHKDFEVVIHKDIALIDACRRRDFTINAIMYDYQNDSFIDFFHGIEDIKNQTLRMIDEKTFKEDPLRVLRLAQFASRFEFNIDEKTKQTCATMVKEGMLQNLSCERIVKEYDKLLMGKCPSLGLTFLQEIKGLFLPLQVLEDCDQRRDFHPEGSVMNHTLLVVDLAALCKEETSWPLAFMWGALLHDIGKPAVTTPTGSAPGHNESGVQAFDAYFKPFIKNKKMAKYIKTMIYYHMHLMNMMRNNSKDYSYYKLLHGIHGIMPIDDLAYISRCDKLGRYASVPDTLNRFDAFIQEKKERLGVEALVPYVNGAVLKNLGFNEGKYFRELLDWAYDLQMKGHNLEEIIQLLKGKKDGR